MVSITQIPIVIKIIPVSPALAVSPKPPQISSVSDEVNSRSAAFDVQLSYTLPKSKVSIVQLPSIHTVDEKSSRPILLSVFIVTSVPSPSMVSDSSSTAQLSDNAPNIAKSIATTIKPVLIQTVWLRECFTGSVWWAVIVTSAVYRSPPTTLGCIVGGCRWAAGGASCGCIGFASSILFPSSAVA